jgi:hypothetical protein
MGRPAADPGPAPSPRHSTPPTAAPAPPSIAPPSIAPYTPLVLAPAGWPRPALVLRRGREARLEEGCSCDLVGPWAGRPVTAHTALATQSRDRAAMVLCGIHPASPHRPVESST